MIDLVKEYSELSLRTHNKWKFLKGKSGVYIFTFEDSVLYVGRSKNLYVRIISHYSNGGICNSFEWDKIHFIFCENHKEIEKHCIMMLNPLYNGNLTSKIYKK